MNQAHQLITVENQAGATPRSNQGRRTAQTATQLSQPLLASLCNRLARAIAARDHVGAGQTRGTLARLSLKHPGRLGLAQRAYHRTMTLGVDA